jgi:hypothetical protein
MEVELIANISAGHFTFIYHKDGIVVSAVLPIFVAMRNILVLIVLIFSVTRSQGQCAIYTADNATWGAGYRADDDPVYTMDELKKIGMDGCKTRGGVNCKLLYSSNEGGWWGLIFGPRSSDGRTIYEAVYGQSSESTARTNLYELYRRHGGTDPDNARIKVWHVKSN